MNTPEPLPETTVTVDDLTIKEKVSDPVMGDTAVKQPMKYTKKK